MRCAGSGLFIGAAGVALLGPSAAVERLVVARGYRSETAGNSPRPIKRNLFDRGTWPICAERSVTKHLPRGLSDEESLADVALCPANISGKNNPSARPQDSSRFAATDRFLGAATRPEGVAVAISSITPAVGRTRNPSASTVPHRLPRNAVSGDGRHAAIEHEAPQGERNR